ncbi:Putative odorant receptor 13a [Harpegnathos saltator]|uniref:Putative odorant receptor 13a n=1 Tax=Harpegnathos saltator TaxID=610380 RepID=E2B2Y3_HARSA|nr:Putative odorant receptor 13a [Harpegnathos saltator]
MEFWDHYYSFMKKLSSFGGQWPYQNKREKLFKISMITTALLIINIPQIKALTDRVFIDWGKLQNPEEYEIMKSYIANARWSALIYFAVCFGGCTIFVLMALIPYILDIVLPLNESRPIVLPYEAYYFVDERKYFLYIFLQGLIALHVVIMGLIAHDTMFIFFVEHACGIFAVAGFRFEHLVHKDTGVMKTVDNELDNMYNKRIACSVHAHRTALEFAEYLENMFSLIFGIEILMVTVGMSITLFQITLQSDDIWEVIRYVIYVGAQLVHLFVFCWEGQRLIDHSLQIRDKIMEFTWDRYYSFMKKLLSFVGQWPYQNKREKLFKMSMMTTALLVMNIPQIKTLTDRVFVDWGRLQSPEEYEIMKTYVANAKWIALIYFAFCLAGTTLFVLVAFIPYMLNVVLPLNESRPIVLPYEAYYFVDERKYFLYIFLQGLIALHVVIMGLIAHDTMFMFFVEHACGTFAVAGFRFERLVHEDTDLMKTVNNDLDMYNKKIACSVHAHRAALE